MICEAIVVYEALGGTDKLLLHFDNVLIIFTKLPNFPWIYV